MLNNVLFSIGLFLSASLLFAIQPMIAKTLLPIYGGSPTVWTVCMLFFQALLLFAYGYAWVLSRIGQFWIWRCLHGGLILLSLMSFPIILIPSTNSNAPDLMILTDLMTQFGLPLMIIGASAPLLQFAYSQTKVTHANDPYFLYAISNLGSLLALLAYPWLIESYLGLKQQFYYWNVGFIIYLVFLLAILFMIPSQLERSVQITKHSAKDAEPFSTGPLVKLPWLLLVRWVGYSFIPCSLMLGVSFYISLDIATTPLFWIIPLVLYLLSFIITFAKKPIISHEWVTRHILFFLIFPMIGFIMGANSLATWQLILFHLVSFFMFALLYHGELVRIKPPVNQLTSFYFCLALGGGLAGVFNGLLASHVFNGAYEYPLILMIALLCIAIPQSSSMKITAVIVLCLLLGNYFLPEYPWSEWLKTNHVMALIAFSILVIWPQSKTNFFAGMVILFIFILGPWFKPTTVLIQQRNFYGVKQVLSVKGAHALVSQSTLHGIQFGGVKQDNGATAYYGAVLPVVQRLQKIHPSLNTAIIGLGTGMMACQFRHSDKLQIIDIDQQVIDIAANPNYFTYLRDCLPAVSLIKGDGRLVLEKSAKSVFDLLVVDAFSSDAIPTHLLTLEAFSLYQQKLKEGGVILVNISNRHLHLLPVLVAAGRELQLLVLHKLATGNSREGKFPAEWVLLTFNQSLAMELMKTEGWRFVTEEANNRLWTDDYSNILPVML